MDYRNGRIGLVYIANQVIPATQEASALFYIDRNYAHIGRINRYSNRANSWGSRSFEGLKNNYLHILFYTKVR